MVIWFSQNGALGAATCCRRGLHELGEFRYSLRMVMKTPGVTAVAILSLALGIGANTAIFSIIDAMLLKRLPVKSPQELYRVTAGEDRSSWSYPDFVAFRDHNTSITLAACTGGMQRLGMQQADAGSATPAEIVSAAVVSGNYFAVLGVDTALGRVLNAGDDHAPGASPYVVLSHNYWQSRFGSDPRVVGRKIRLNGYPFTIVGVSRRGFHGTDPSAFPDIFVPVLMYSEISGQSFTLWNTRHWWWLTDIGRIKPGSITKQAETEIFAIYQEQEQTELRTVQDQRFVNRAQPIVLQPAATGHSYFRTRLEKPLLILMSVVGLVLLIACANVASLMLVRGTARQREMAIRLAVGATRARLTGQLLVESIIIALSGGIAGLLLSHFGTGALLTFVAAAESDPGSMRISPDLRLLGFVAAVSLLTGVLSVSFPPSAPRKSIPWSRSVTSRSRQRQSVISLEPVAAALPVTVARPVMARVHAGGGYVRIQGQVLRITEPIRYAVGGRGEPVEELVVSQIPIKRVKGEPELPCDIVEVELVPVAAVRDFLPPGLHGGDHLRVVVPPDQETAGDEPVVRRVALVPVARQLAVNSRGIIHSATGDDIGFLVYAVPVRVFHATEQGVWLGQKVREKRGRGRLEADSRVVVDADLVVGQVLVGQYLDAAGIASRIGGKAAYMDNLPGA